MFRNNAALGIALITGKISGNLEAIDIDTKNDLDGDLMKTFYNEIRQSNPVLATKLIMAQTRSNGFHLIYRCSEPGRNTALAKRPTTEQELQKDPKQKCKVLIETRSEAGYIVIAPTPGYKILQGNITNIPSIQPQERELLFTIARSFNTYIEKQIIRQPPKIRTAGELTPWDDFNRRGDIISLLEKHGWKTVRQNKERTWFRRPGNTDQFSSANYNHHLGLLRVFSPSTDFQTDRGYRPFEVFAILECNYNITEAARKLTSLGYGQKKIIAPTDISYKRQSRI